MMTRPSILLFMVFLTGLSSRGADAPADVTPARTDANGIVVHELRSPFESGPTHIRVLAPNPIDKKKHYPVIYVLPVEASNDDHYGDGLMEVKRNDLHNKYQAAFVAPTFSRLPWYADHPSDPEIRQETYLLSAVLPFVEKSYPVRTDSDGRLLMGFSKSGWGAFSLLLRHPDLFGRAAAWDAPLMMDWPSQYGSGPIFATRENFEQYQISRLLEKRASDPGATKRLILMGYGNFHRETDSAHALMERLKIPHEFVAGPERKHEWGSGWVPEAVKLLVSPETKGAGP